MKDFKIVRLTQHGRQVVLDTFKSNIRHFESTQLNIKDQSRKHHTKDNSMRYSVALFHFQQGL